MSYMTNLHCELVYMFFVVVFSVDEDGCVILTFSMPFVGILLSIKIVNCNSRLNMLTVPLFSTLPSSYSAVGEGYGGVPMILIFHCLLLRGLILP